MTAHVGTARRVLAIRLEPEVIGKVKAQAKSEGMTASAWIEAQAIKALLKPRATEPEARAAPTNAPPRRHAPTCGCGMCRPVAV